MFRRTGALGLAALAIAISCAVACRQLAGITDNPPEALTSTASGLPYGTSACASCAAMSCSSESSACAASALCDAYESCLGPCDGDPKCRSQCTIDHPTGDSAEVSALGTCLASSCETACGLACGAVAADVSPPEAAKACQDCIATASCDQARACGISVDCEAYLRCLLARPTFETAGVVSCQTAHPTGAALYASAFGLTTTGGPPDAGVAVGVSGVCATQCGTGSYWACVGRESFSGAAETITLDLYLWDFNTGVPVSGVDILVCNHADSSCTSPYGAPGRTDDSGQATLVFPNVLDPIGQGLQGYVRLTSANTVPLDFYLGYPLRAAHQQASTPVVSPGAVQLLASAESVTLDSSRGIVVVTVEDCFRGFASGVNVAISSADAMTRGFDSTTFAPSSTTDRVGTLIFTNVPAGDSILTATTPSVPGPVSQVTVNVQPGEITEADMLPQ